jgi:hypothetical protein
VQIESWNLWQQEVVAVIRADFITVLDDIDADGIDWETWRPFFEEGRSPQDAVKRAFANDL